MTDQKPLFIPLKTEYFEAFNNGTKTVEYRRYGKRWNEKTCPVGRKVTLSKGYGTKDLIAGVVSGFSVQKIETEEWIACYGEPGEAACIKIEIADDRS